MYVKIYDYLILSAETRKELIAKVREKMEKGWEPQGSVSWSPEDKRFMQAVITRQEK